MDALEKAIMIISATKNELALGTKHYTKGGTLLTEARDIIIALKNNDLVIEPTPERQYLFSPYRIYWIYEI